MNVNQKRHGVFFGWWIVAASFLLMAYTGGAIIFGFTAVIEPIANEFGWSYAQISFAASIRGMEMGLLAPLLGMLVDRWGPRRLAFLGAFMTGLGAVLLSRINSLGMYYAAFILIAIGVSTASTTVLLVSIVHWFHKKLGIASGIVISGYGLGGAMVPLVTLLIDTYQWRTAVLILALGMWVICLPLSLLMRHKPEPYGYLPDGEIADVNPVVQTVTSAPNTEVDFGVKQALTSSAFWHITLSLVYHGFALGAVVTHIMPYLSSIGIARSTSSLAASALPVVSIGGRLGFGWLGDKFNKTFLAAWGFALIGLGLLFFAYIADDRVAMLVPFLILLGIGWGGNVTMRVSLIREYFGKTRFATIHGFAAGIITVGNVIGAPVAGWVFDKWGSYQGAWLVFAGLAVAALLIMLTTPPIQTAAQLTASKQ